MPSMAIGRQAMAALVPEGDRRTALSLDAIGVELTFMIAPALAVLDQHAVLHGHGAARDGLFGDTASGLALYLDQPAGAGRARA